MQNSYYFLYHHEIAKETVESVAAKIDEQFDCTVEKHIFKKSKSGFGAGSTVFMMADDAGFAHWIKRNASADITVVILPFEQNPHTCTAYSVPADPDEALALAAAESPFCIKQLLTCNGNVVLDRVMIGRSDWHRGTSVLAFIKAFFKGLFSLKLQPVQIETAKGQKSATAMLLIEAGAEGVMSRRFKHLFRSHEDQCTRAAMLIYAPQSVLSMLRLRLLSVSKNGSDEEALLPEGTGTLKSTSIVVRASTGKLRIVHDGVVSETETAALESTQTTSGVVSGFQGCIPPEDKESLRLQNLPKDEETIAHLSSKTLPFIPVASEAAFAELFTVLREEARSARWYIVLLLLSTLLAATGLFQNSSPTVIGAMILSPLMAPVVVFAMGLVRFDRHLLLESSRTLGLSVVLALAASALYAYAVPLTHMTVQMSSRLHPNLLDLAVAILSGIAAAYGYAHARIAKSLAGVAIAVALVPPLSVAGIGIGWASWAMFSGAFLLFTANIAGIIASAGVTFFLMGFSSWRYAKTAFAVKLVMLSAVAFPLYLSTATLIETQAFYSRFDHLAPLQAGKSEATLQLQSVSVENGVVTAAIIITVPEDLEAKQKQQLIHNLKEKLGETTRLTILFQYRYD